MDAATSVGSLPKVFHAPDRPIDGGMPTEGLIAHVAVSKFGDAQPLYRQVQILAGQGVTLDRSTRWSWRAADGFRLA